MLISYMPSTISGIISGSISIDEFATHMESDIGLAEKIMEWWSDMGIGVRLHDDTYRYESGQRLEAAIILLQQGYLISDVAPYLDWRDFEGLAGRILESEGFDVTRNCIMKKPRMQIDVIGERMGMGMIVDCKHWRRGTPGHQVMVNQLRRAQRWSDVHDMDAMPVVVTLYEHTLIRSIENVPIVPIMRFRSFVNDIFGDDNNWTLKPAG